MKNIFLAAGTAILSSACCITPAIVMLAGTGSFASALSWLNPVRPYFIGLTVVLLGFAWYRQLRSPRTPECTCNTSTKPKFMVSKLFLGMVTVFATLMMTFPYYAHLFYSKPEKDFTIVQVDDMQLTEFAVSGMSCEGCEAYITQQVSKLPGIVSITASYRLGQALVKYDKTKVTADDIAKVITDAGYQVTEIKHQ